MNMVYFSIYHPSIMSFSIVLKLLRKYMVSLWLDLFLDIFVLWHMYMVFLIIFLLARHLEIQLILYFDFYN